MAVKRNTKAQSQKAFTEAIRNFLGAGIEAEPVDQDQFNMACYLLLESPQYKILVHEWRNRREDCLSEARKAETSDKRAYAFACAEVYKDIITDTLFAAKAHAEAQIEKINKKIP